MFQLYGSGFKQKRGLSDRFPQLASLFNERCSYNAMIEFVTIKKLKG